jgi:hypothetical protein
VLILKNASTATDIDSRNPILFFLAENWLFQNTYEPGAIERSNLIPSTARGETGKARFRTSCSLKIQNKI